jgi:peptidoglycan-associated lipoprotein
MRKTIMVLLVAAALGIAACGPKPKESPPAETAVNTNTGADTSGVDSSGASAGEGEEIAGPQQGLLARRTIYFDFDSSEIRGEGTEIVAAHARNLAGSNAVRVRLEGHTDERGSREYNIGLGERRAQAVRRALLLQGASEAQLSTVSYGEERPAGAGSDESAWAQNRRVEIVYLK